MNWKKKLMNVIFFLKKVKQKYTKDSFMQEYKK